MKFGYQRWILMITAVVMTLAGSVSVAAEPGDGLHSEDGWKATPSLTFAGGYTSNLFRSASEEPAPVVDAISGDFTPALAVHSPENSNFLLTFDGSATWKQYFDGVASEAPVNLSKQSGLSTNLGLDGHLNPEGNVSLKVGESFVRRNVPPPAPSSATYNWIANTLGATVGIHPGARILTLDLGYDWHVRAHGAGFLEVLDRQEHRFKAKTEWRFLPKTRLIARADYGIVAWGQEQRERTDEGGNVQRLSNIDSRPFRTMGGFGGVLTPRITFRLLAGYGWSRHEQGPGFSGVIGNAAVIYSPGTRELDEEIENSIELGYKRGFGEAASVGNFYSRDDIYATYKQGLWNGLVDLSVSARFQLRNYELSEEDRLVIDSLNDELLAGRAKLGVNPTKWWTIAANYGVSANFTDDQYEVPAFDPNDPEIPVLRKYLQHNASLSTTFRY
jgi:hypothetical protein